MACRWQALSRLLSHKTRLRAGSSLKSRYRASKASRVAAAVDREATSVARPCCAFCEIAVFLTACKGRRYRRASHPLGAPNLARAIDGMHWPCEGTPLCGLATAHPGKHAQPRRCRHQSSIADTHEHTEMNARIHATLFRRKLDLRRYRPLPPRSHSHQPLCLPIRAHGGRGVSESGSVQ